MSKFEIFTDSELMKLLQEAIELRDGKWIKALRLEILRRNKDE